MSKRSRLHGGSVNGTTTLITQTSYYMPLRRLSKRTTTTYGNLITRRLSNPTTESHPQLSKACQPCTSAAHSRAPPPRTAVPPPPLPPRSLTHARSLSRSACRLARIPPHAGVASHHLPEGFCILCIASAPSTASHSGRYLALTTGATPTASAPPLATRCTTARPRLPAPSTRTRRRRLSPPTSARSNTTSAPTRRSRR